MIAVLIIGGISVYIGVAFYVGRWFKMRKVAAGWDEIDSEGVGIVAGATWPVTLLASIVYMALEKIFGRR